LIPEGSHIGRKKKIASALIPEGSHIGRKKKIASALIPEGSHIGAIKKRIINWCLKKLTPHLSKS